MYAILISVKTKLKKYKLNRKLNVNRKNSTKLYYCTCIVKISFPTMSKLHVTVPNIPFRIIIGL